MSLFDKFGQRWRLSSVRAANTARSLGIPLRPRGRVVYHPDYVTTIRETTARHAFDTLRPRRIADKLTRAGVLGPGTLLTPQVPAEEDLLLVHTPGFLKSIARPEQLAQLMLVGSQVMPADDPLRGFLLQTGGTMLAARKALADGVPVINLGGGFHHAQRDKAEGFCPINDVAVTIRWLQERGLVRRVLVVDLDFHQGNGTALIFSQDENVFTVSIHGQTWSRILGKRHHLDVELPPGVTDQRYLRAVRRALAYALSGFSPDLAIYVAGADVFAGDVLGDFAVSEDGVLSRDLLVWDVLQDAGVPLAAVLAGGYGPMAWTISYNFAFSALTGSRILPEHRPSNIRAMLKRVRRRIRPAELKTGAGPEEEIQLAEDLLTDRTGRGGDLLLDYYTCEGMEIALDRYGFLALLRERGFSNLLFYLDASDAHRQVFRVHFDRRDPQHLLVEMVLRFRQLVTPAEVAEEGIPDSFQMLSIEWLTMQDPTAHFTLERQKLPGQSYPGLGVGRWTVELLRLMAERVDCAGLMNIPQHYHNGFLYSKQMLCFDPRDQGYLEAMKRDLGRLPLVETSEGINAGRLRGRHDDGDEPILWEGKAQVMPIEADLNRYFTRTAYIDSVTQARNHYGFYLVDG